MKDEIESYDWRKYLKFSKMLVKNELYLDDAETNKRVAISRAYYAAFHYAKKFLEVNDFENGKSSGEHQMIISIFKEMKKKDKNFQNQCRKIGNNLERMKSNRVSADYKDKFTLSDKDVEDHLKKSEKLIKSIDKLKTDYNCQ